MVIFSLNLLIRQRLRLVNRQDENVNLLKWKRHVPNRSPVFDCDGTLVDSEVICSRAYVHMFKTFGITTDLDEILSVSKA